MTSQGARSLRWDVPVALLVGAASVMSARIAGAWALSGAPDPGGPPWRGGHGGGGQRWATNAPGSGGFVNPWTTDIGEPYTWVAVGWVLIVGTGIAVRRIRPRTGYGLTVIGAAGDLASGLPFFPILAGPVLGLVAVANRRTLRQLLWWAGLLIPMVWTGFLHRPGLGLTDPDFYTTCVLGVAAMALPAFIATTIRTRHDARRRARELDLRRATYQERLRIVRDVHDVIGHSLSVINMQAGVAMYVQQKNRQQPEAQHQPSGDGGDGQDPDPDAKVAESLQAIRSTSKSALDELRAVLAVFRQDSGEMRAPTAGLNRLDELVQSFRAAGRTVTVTVPDGMDLPGPVDRVAYRIIQEALTNVARHTAQAAAHVVVRIAEQTLIIEITDDGPRVAQDRVADGNGLHGMAERVRAVGGTLRAGPLPEHGFGVSAELPVSGSGSRTSDDHPPGHQQQPGNDS